METGNITAVARHLFEAYGAKAIAEAARKAASFEESGDGEQAQFWRRVQGVVLEMRGPRQS